MHISNTLQSDSHLVSSQCMLFCRCLGKLPKAGLLRIKSAPEADIQLLVSGCEVHHLLAQHLITAEQHSSQQALAQADIEVAGLHLFVSRYAWLRTAYHCV